MCDNAVNNKQNSNQSDNQTTSEHQASDKQTSTTKEYKNDNNIRTKEDLKEKISTSRDKKETEPKFNFKNALLDLGVPPELVDEWLTIRKAKKAVNTKIAFDVIVREANKAGITVAEAVAFSAQRQYRGFEAQWYINHLQEMNKTNGGGAGFSAAQMQAIVDVGVEMAHRWGSSRND